jgi:UDP-N-acetylmuramoyl-tripeptide--D-alanyl-D-alanine ligase
MFQQNSYRIERYLKWRKGQRKFRGYDIAVLYSVICFTASAFVTVDLGRLGLQVCGYLFLLVSGLGFKWHIEASPQKKELVYTDRVKRLSLTMLILYGLFFLASLYLPDLLVIIFSGLIVYLSFVTVLKANYINKPMETNINNRFIQDAKRRLKENPNLIIIGITGSYGKTSVKNILYHLLSQKYNVLMTPESYNTLLGVTRTIRERLLPTHEVFIVEMGAKQTVDI